MPEFSLHAHQRLASGLRDTTLEQFDQVIAALAEPGDLDRAVHEARKAMKRIRALLRLVRPVIGDDVYRVENAILRDTARIIAPIRDGRVMVDTVSDLRERYDRQLRPTAFEGIERALEERQQRRHSADDVRAALGPRPLCRVAHRGRSCARSPCDSSPV
jgi:CHAD domain-containing protein